MACDRIERKIAHSEHLIGDRPAYVTDRELVQHLLKMEREREAKSRRARMYVIEGGIK